MGKRAAARWKLALSPLPTWHMPTGVRHADRLTYLSNGRPWTEGVEAKRIKGWSYSWAAFNSSYSSFQKIHNTDMCRLVHWADEEVIMQNRSGAIGRTNNDVYLHWRRESGGEGARCVVKSIDLVVSHSKRDLLCWYDLINRRPLHNHF